MLGALLLTAVVAGCATQGLSSITTQPGTTGPLASIGSGSGRASPAATIVVPGPTTRGSSTTTTPPTSAPLGLVRLRYALVDALGRPVFCDPDFYPVARSDEAQLAELRYPEIKADAETYRAITDQLGISGVAKPAAAQVLAIYREWKMLRALLLQPAANGYRFDYVAAGAAGSNQNWHVTGTISGAGTIAVEHRDPAGPLQCPICLARGTAIATPGGSVAVEELRVGMIIWTADSSGRRVALPLQVLGSTAVPPTHEVVHLVLSDGRVLEASPGHPLPDGRPLGDLRSGDLVDGAVVATAQLVPYAGGATYDLLPDGQTGTYWANGIPLASTLHASN